MITHLFKKWNSRTAADYVTERSIRRLPAVTCFFLKLCLFLCYILPSIKVDDDETLSGTVKKNKNRAMLFAIAFRESVGFVTTCASCSLNIILQF